MLTLKIVQFLAILTVAGCSGCGGGSDPAVPCTPQTIQLFGDSTQHYAAPYWQARYGDVTDLANPGTDSLQMLTGTDGSGVAWPGLVSAQVVVIKHGTNDANPGFGVPLATYEADLRFFVANSNGAKVILETPDPSIAAAESTLPSYVDVMRKVAADTHTPLIDTDACWRAQANWQAMLQPDGIHALPAGTQFTVQNCVAPVVDALECR
jgi:hypothetical protein